MPGTPSTGQVDHDDGHGIAVDTSGNVYVTGYSDATWGSPLNAHSGGGDIFVLKLNSSGAYQWHTFYGSSELMITVWHRRRRQRQCLCHGIERCNLGIAPQCP